MTCQCGRPIGGPGGNLCADCADTMRDNLVKIADRWAELEDALSWRDQWAGEQGAQKRGHISAGIVVNGQAARAIRLATDAVWFTVQVIREDYDTLGRRFAPPRGRRDSAPSVPVLARWVARWHLSHVTHGMAEETAVEIYRDVARAESAGYAATHPSGGRWIDVGLPCEGSGEPGTPPCPGRMQVRVGGRDDHLPDLVCTTDPTHRVDPSVWARFGWRRTHRALDPDAARTLTAMIVDNSTGA